VSAGRAAGAGPAGCYATVRRGSRTGCLLGRHPGKQKAGARGPEDRRLAGQAGPFTAFDGFGVTRVVMRPGAQLPPGVLNDMAGPEAQ
jgi:hypothetical protein